MDIICLMIFVGFDYISNHISTQKGIRILIFDGTLEAPVVFKG